MYPWLSVANQDLWKDGSVSEGEKFVLAQASPAIKLEEETYIDDCLSGHNSKPEDKKKVQEIEDMIAPGNFGFKSVTYSGDDVEPLKILGLVWCPKKDVLSLPVRVNSSAKVKGWKL